MNNAVSVWDFTAFTDNADQVKELLGKHCKKWCFQLERAPGTGRLHMQGRMSLKVKERLQGVVARFAGWHLSITANENKHNTFYVTKEESRVAGPWNDTDEVLYIPRQVRGIVLKPWQQHILDDAGVWNTRTINIIYDVTGNIGKTTLCTYVGAHRFGRKIPFSNDFRDIMRMVMDCPQSKLYLFDMPRAIRKDQLNQFFSAVEEIKNGYVFDDRYRFRERYFDSPNIWIFTNVLPDFGMLSADRWCVWRVVDDNLVPWVEGGLNGDLEAAIDVL